MTPEEREALDRLRYEAARENEAQEDRAARRFRREVISISLVGLMGLILTLVLVG